jgi:hypothetical protein
MVMMSVITSLWNNDHDEQSSHKIVTVSRRAMVAGDEISTEFSFEL